MLDKKLCFAYNILEARIFRDFLPLKCIKLLTSSKIGYIISVQIGKLSFLKEVFLRKQLESSCRSGSLVNKYGEFLP